MINWILKLFWYEIVKVWQIDELNEQLTDKSKKVRLYFKEMNDSKLDYNLLLQHFKEIKEQLDILTNNNNYLSWVTFTFDDIKELVWSENLRILSWLIYWIQNEIVKESTRSNITEKEVVYRAWAIDICNTLIKKLNDLHIEVKKAKWETTEKETLDWSN